jgi:hypothetical protein
MKVLVACEFSGIVREAFRKRGHDAWSCDLLPSEQEGPHIQGDVLEHLDEGWDLMIAHPPCTYLAVSGAAHFNKPGRRQKQEEALGFFCLLLNAPIRHICVENPVGITSTRVRKPDQWIQPYEFGHEAMKKTGLWLEGLPLLRPTKVVGRGPIWTQKNGRTRGSRWHMCLPQSPDRWRIRSRTFQGIADAMAEQWGGLG